MTPTATPRRLFLVRKNTAIDLCHLGRHAEAQRLLASLRSAASLLDQDLEILRLQWLEARVAAGLGHPADALAAFDLVLSRFVDLGLAYDAALVTLELAEIHALLGHPTEVKTLAHESAPIFPRRLSRVGYARTLASRRCRMCGKTAGRLIRNR